MQLVKSLEKEFSLPRSVAKEIVITETRRKMRSKWQTWFLLAAAIANLVWVLSRQSYGFKSFSTLIIIVTIGWFLHCCKLAIPAIRLSAQSKSNLHRSNSL